MRDRIICGPALKELRETAKMSRRELAEAANISEGTLRNAECGATQLGYGPATRIALTLSARLRKIVRVDDFTHQSEFTRVFKTSRSREQALHHRLHPTKPGAPRPLSSSPDTSSAHD